MATGEVTKYNKNEEMSAVDNLSSFKNAPVVS